MLGKPNKKPTDWRELFIGRESEIVLLQDAWKEAKDCNPQLIVLRGESGLGKTRVIQEFYKWLSRPEIADAGDYWPDSLFCGDNLKINPDLTRHEFNTSGLMNYLWWGLRWTAPDGRNLHEVTHCAFYDQKNKIKPHWEYISRYKDGVLVGLKLTKKVASVGIELAKSTAMSLFPLFGFIQTAVNIGTIISSIGSSAIDVHDEIRRGLLNPAQLQEKEIKEQVRQVVDFLGWVLKPFYKTGSGSLPIVLILDDAQWMDQLSIDIVNELFENAIENGWPLLIVATHWEREWHENINESELFKSEKNKPKQTPSNFAELYHQLNRKHKEYSQLIDLKKIKGQAEIIEMVFSGLTSDQIFIISDLSDGNPRLLSEILLHIMDEPILFEDGDLKSQFNKSAIEELKTDVSQLGLNNLLSTRFKKLSIELKKLLAIASLQGETFVSDLVIQIMSRIESCEESQAIALLDKAISPYAVLSKDGEAWEFRAKAYFEHAARFMKKMESNHSKNPQIYYQTLIAIIDNWLSPGTLNRLSNSEKEVFLKLAVKYKKTSDPEYLSYLGNLVNLYSEIGQVESSREYAKEILSLVQNQTLPLHPCLTKVEFLNLGFYKNYNLCTFTDYSLMPSFQVSYLSNGIDSHIITGSPSVIKWANANCLDTLNEKTIEPYLDFYFSFIHPPEGKVTLIKNREQELLLNHSSPPNAPIVTNKFIPLTITKAPKADSYQVQTTLSYNNSYFNVEIDVGANGDLALLHQEFITNQLPIFELQVDGTLFKRLNDAPKTTYKQFNLDWEFQNEATPSESEALVLRALQIIKQSSYGEQLVQALNRESTAITIFHSPQELHYMPHTGEILISLTLSKENNMGQFVLRLAGALRYLAQELEGNVQTNFDAPSTEQVKTAMNKQADAVSYMCAVAHQLSNLDHLEKYHFQQEICALGYQESWGTFVSNL